MPSAPEEAALTIQDGDITPVLTVNILEKSDSLTVTDSIGLAVPLVVEDEIIAFSKINTPLATDNHSKDGNQIATAEHESEQLIALNSPISNSLAVGLLFVANVAGQRGWKLSRVGDEDKVIQGDLDELRKMQSSRKYSSWQKRDFT